jgi:Fe-S oxidoreductase
MPQVSASNVLSSLASLFKGKTVLHMGCKDCGNEEAYLGVKVLNKLGMSIDVKEFQCGCEFYGADDAKIRALVAENKKILKGYGTVIVGCARCLQVFKEYYGINARHITQVIAERLEGMDRKFIGTGDVLYHDPCFMARYSKIMDEPRAILAKLGYNVVEFKNCREKSDCCGDYSPIQAMRERGTVLRLSQVKSPGTVTAACPKCTLNFSCFNRANSKITVKPFLELVDYALNMDIPSVF